MASRYDLTKKDLGKLLEGEPKYRVDQVWHGIYGQKIDPSDITTLEKSLREKLANNPDLQLALSPSIESVADDGETVKWLFDLHDGRQVETVLMHYNDRSTVCVSSQAGCAMACGFCATGQAGFDRHLSTGEIVEQIVRAQQNADSQLKRVSNIVFMGMGEPLANYDRVWKAVERIHADLGISARHITISTVGIVPGIKKLAAEKLPVNLAVSLHAANDELRNELVPINKRYPIADLMSACGEYLDAKNRRLSLEWALIDDVNDRPSDVRELAVLSNELSAHVNVIPLNPTPGYAVKGSSRERVNDFAQELRDSGVNVTIRNTRGSDIDAACGQLRANAQGRQEKRSNVQLNSKHEAN